MSLSRDQVLRLLGLVLGLMLFGFLVEMYIFYGRRRNRRRVAARLENSVAVARAPETEESNHGAEESGAEDALRFDLGVPAADVEPRQVLDGAPKVPPTPEQLDDFQIGYCTLA